jgi:hypothetical protein
MDIPTIVTIAAIVIGNIGTTILLFTWATTHAATATHNHRQETQSILKGIADEMKDFHGRLCEIEARRK